MKSSRLLKMPRAIETGFSGVSVAPATGSEYDISVSCGDAFDCIRIYTTGAASPNSCRYRRMYQPLIYRRLQEWRMCC